MRRLAQHYSIIRV